MFRSMNSRSEDFELRAAAGAAEDRHAADLMCTVEVDDQARLTGVEARVRGEDRRLTVRERDLHAADVEVALGRLQLQLVVLLPRAEVDLRAAVREVVRRRQHVPDGQ